MKGFETEHLIELAGITKPYNQFELRDLTDKVFDELNLEYHNREQVLTDYATYLAQKAIDGEKKIMTVLSELKNLCIELDYDRTLYDFYTLYFAKDDLEYSEMQWYWEGANRDNIDEICMNYFRNWIEEHPLNDLNIEEKRN